MKKHHRATVALLWICGAAITAHLLYSALGFNPTDDGFTLAYARRLLDGQVPHRDFIIIRPALSPALHVPEVLLGGHYTYWFSRFVFFFQCACIAWFGTAFINRGLGCPLVLFDQCAFAVVSFAFCCHSFPVIAWHTIDGLFLCVLACHFRSRSFAYFAPIAYFLMGLAYLCKQSFILVAPVMLLILGDWKNWKCLAASALPGILYVAFLIFSGGILDGLQQLLSQTGIVQVGFHAYLNSRVFSGVTVGIVATSLLYSKTLEGWPRGATLRRAAGLALIAVAFILATKSLFNDGVRSSSFALFGCLCGAVIYFILEAADGRIRQVQTGAAVALLAWSASLSLGYNSPVLGSGILLTFLFGLSYPQFSLIGPRWRPLMSLGAAFLAISAFHHTRTHHIYRERPASELTISIGNVLPGGRLIRTNCNTHEFLVDLNSAIDNVVTNGMRYAIIPAIAGHWVKSEQENPLPIDWAQGNELNTPVLLNRVINSIQEHRSQQMVIVQKVRAANLASGFVELKADTGYYATVDYVRTHLEKVGETRYFEIYK